MLAPHYRRVLLAAAVVGTLLIQSTVAPALAIDFAPDAEEILVPTGEWLEILPGERHLYEFSYDSFKQADGYLSSAKVEVEVAEKDSVQFKVYSSVEIEEWQNSGNLNAVGMGSRLNEVTFNTKDEKKLVWTSRSEASQHYYVIVENARSVPGYYEIEITGSGVAFPHQPAAETDANSADEQAAPTETVSAETGAQEEVFEESEALETAPASPASAEGGTGPEDALPPPEAEVTLEPGEKRWYTYMYYRDAGKPATQVISLLKMPIEGTISYEVWTTDTVRQWVNNEKINPIGVGTPINYGVDYPKDPNILVWVGSAEAGGRYYIIVENESDQPASFSLTVTGTNISY